MTYFSQNRRRIGFCKPFQAGRGVRIHHSAGCEQESRKESVKRTVKGSLNGALSPKSPSDWILQAFSSRARKNFEFNRRKGQDNHAEKGVKAPLPAVFLPFLLLFIPEAHSLRNDLPEEKPTKGIDKAESGALERGGMNRAKHTKYVQKKQNIR